MIKKLIYRFFPNIVDDIKRQAIDEWMKLKIRESKYDVHIVHSTYEDADNLYEFGVTKTTNKHDR